jgi:glycosyltransferase involved in cell wall biosynthesis
MREATVLIPTFDHGRLIRHALASAQAQTLRDIEIFVVGDGAPAITRETVTQAAAADPRIRYFDNAKGERVGERHRHRAIAEATGRIVCYLSDDDLWFPDHLAEMARLLKDADFAAGMQGRLHPDGRLYAQAADVALLYYRRPTTRLAAKIGLSAGGHTLELYRRLPEGWRPAPPDSYSDQHMWQQIWAVPGCRAVSSVRPTGLGFTSAIRKTMSLEEREREIGQWAAAIADPGRLQQLREAILAEQFRDATRDANFLAWRNEVLENRPPPSPPPLIERLWRRMGRGQPAPR